MATDPTLSWCFVRDFNAVRSRSESKGVGIFSSHSERREFDEFIDSNNLIDLPLLRRKYTWYKKDANAMSRIDRFLLSENWCPQWSN